MRIPYPFGRRRCEVESLESRKLLAAAAISVTATFPNASETSPTRTGRGEFLFTRTGGSLAAPLVVNYSVKNTSTATSGADFQALTGTVTIPASKRSVAINLFPIDDATVESTETVIVAVTSTNRYKINAAAANATVNIADNDTNVPTTVGVYASFPNASETNPHSTGRGEFVFSRLSGSTVQPLVLQYYVKSNSTAVSGQDFEPLAGTITIPARKRSVALNLFAIDDANVESPETVIMVVKDGNYTIVHRTGTVTIADNDVAPPDDWFGDSRTYRTPIDISAGSIARSNQPVDRSINFTSILSSLGRNGSLIHNSIKVVETSADGLTELDDSVPFQFDHASNYNASSNASGTLIIQTEGATAANTTRHYQVYFDVTGSFSAPSFTPLVTTTDDIDDPQGINSIKIETSTATYYYEKDFGGFSSIIDANGHDWLSWNLNGGSDGSFRGTPNLGPVGFHPGRAPTESNGSTPDSMETDLISSGPLKTVIESIADETGNKVRWEIYDTFARCIVLSMDRNYWFLYEGTPGGDIDGNDTVVESDGTSTNILSATPWDHDKVLGENNNEEWAYFRDSAVNSGNGRFLFYVHNTPDNIVDSYFTLDNNMTVFGFGRQNDVGSFTPHELLTPGNNLNNIFTIGLSNGGSNFTAASNTIKGIYKNVTTSQGTSEIKP